MSKLILAIDSLLNNEPEAVETLNMIIQKATMEKDNFVNQENLVNYEEIIGPYKVIFGLSKAVAIAKDGGQTVTKELIIYAVFNPLGGKRIFDNEIISGLEKTILENY